MDTRRRVEVTGIHDPTHHTDQGHMVKCELDSHADTCILGSNIKMIELTGEVVDVVPYHEEYEAKKDVPIISAAMAWTHPDTGEMFILDYHQALWYGKEVVERIRLGSLRQSLRITVVTLTDPRVILRQLWCA